jgi:two-component system, OmpR family, sensor kinase
VESRGSSIRSAARATFSAPKRVPIRWRLAGGSALLTLVILCGFAGAVGTLTAGRIHSDFDTQVRGSADRLQARLEVHTSLQNEPYVDSPGLDTFVGGTNAAIKVVYFDGQVIKATKGAPAWLGVPTLGTSIEYHGWRIENRRVTVTSNFDGHDVGYVYMQYARPVADVNATVNRVRFFLLVGVLSGAGLALLAGLWIATRAMAPIAELTAAAREIERTRDPARRVPTTEADDEVAELSRTLDDMLEALDEARTETEAALQRQREFVADASHELRTPLTSVLANLELLAETLDGDRGEAAQSALRSSRRMRRLVADLLLLARADAERQAPKAPTDVGEVLMEAAGELSAVSDGHDLHVDANHAVVDGARDELHRLALNLMENAVRHTPPGTTIRAGVEAVDDTVVLTVEDDGPGIPPELRDRVFERFVRGSGDRGKSFGLGLSIVRAVAESHGGSVRVESPIQSEASIARGTRFVVTLPAAAARERTREPEPQPTQA